MKIEVYEGEWYPVPRYQTQGDNLVEVPDELVQRYEAAKQAFWDAASDLQKAYDAALKA